MRAVRAVLKRPRIPLLLSFLIPAVFRAIPEILAGPYPIGFDTVTWYAPIIAGAQRNGLGSAFNLIIQSQRAPLFNSLLVVTALIPVHPFSILKVTGPLLLGFFSLCVYVMVRTVFRVNREVALFTALFVSLYFVTLRLSWDLFRNLFGYAIFLLTIRQMYATTGTRNTVLVGVMAILTFLSHELVGVLLLSTLMALSARIWWKERRVHAPYVFLALVGLVALAYYAHWLVSPGDRTVLGSVPIVPRGLVTNYLELDGFFGYEGVGDLYLSVLSLSALVLLPLLLLVFRSSRPRAQIGIWTGLLLVAGLSPLILPVFAAPLWYRWILMAAVPLAVLAAIQVSQKSPRVAATISVILLLSASLYAFLPAGSALPVFASSYTVRFLPSSMLQNTGPLQDSPSIIEVLEWLTNNAPSGSLLLAHYAFTGWALLYTEGVEIQTYFRFEELDLSSYQRQGSIYTIWWTTDVGWYSTEEFHSRFVPAFRVGRIGIFHLVNI